MSSHPNLRLLDGGSEVPTAREIAYLDTDWVSRDGRNLYDFLTDTIGPVERDGLYIHANYYIAAKRAGGSL